MQALLAGSELQSDPLQHSNPYHPSTLSSSPQSLRQLHSPQHAQHDQHAQQEQHVQPAQQHSPQHAQQAQPQQHRQQAQQALQQASQSQQPIKVSLLPGSNKLLTPGQVKDLPWQNHLELCKVYPIALIRIALAPSPCLFPLPLPLATSPCLFRLPLSLASQAILRMTVVA